MSHRPERNAPQLAEEICNGVNITYGGGYFDIFDIPGESLMDCDQVIFDHLVI
jgi:hypothetical protein